MGKLGTPSGTRDFGPSQMAKRNFIFESISTVFKKYGFRQLETPAFENLSVLMGKYGEEGDKLLFKILNSGDFLKKTSAQDYEAGAQQMLSKVSDRGLKYDLTVPFARYVVQNRGELTFPFKRYQIQPVWRADRPQRGRYREFYQCDADVIGTNSLICEAEIIAMIQEVFSKLKVEGYTLKLNNRKILAGIAEAVGAHGKETDLCVAIDKLDKIGQEKVNIELAERGFSQEAIAGLAPILGLTGNTSEKLQQLKTALASSETGMAGVEEVEKVFSYAKTMGLQTDNIELDISLARGLNYYTGAIFEVKAPEGVQIGSISGGGRYDDLTGVFGFKDMSGVGISFGIDRIYDVMEELDLFPEDSQKGVEVMFVNFDANCEAYCLPLLQQLRAKGVEAEIFPDSAKMKKQMNYANKNNIQYVVLAGDNEINEGKVTLKNMETGDQQLISKDLLPDQF
ncbi:histidine--tRNA ligase [Flammeovirgaceae bacterium SG7u.111]|nr:histidine--tRNA ligase [Flammeovirgaceae bacterium SG7u.132]WPO37700.1 histidine--tRNA ligase [Flammeovirgaceae bacterium SG7u.111]